MAELLLKQGAEVNPIGRVSALQLAAQRNDFEMVKLLLENGSDVNHNPHSITPPALYAATTNGNLEMMAMLLEAGADVNIEANELNKQRGQTSLHLAVELRDLPAVELLLEHPDININVGHGCDGSVLQTAVLGRNLGYVEMLLSHGADVNLAALTCYGEATKSPLRLVESRGCLAIAEALLKAGACVDPSSDSRELEYLLTDTVGRQRQHSEVAKLLLRTVAESPSVWPMNHKRVFTSVVRSGQVEVWSMLLDYVSERDREHLPLAFRCSAEGGPELMRLSLSLCLDLSPEDLMHAKDVLEREIAQAQRGLQELAPNRPPDKQEESEEPEQDEPEQDQSEQNESESRRSEDAVAIEGGDNESNPAQDSAPETESEAAWSERSISSARDLVSEDEDQDSDPESVSSGGSSSQYSLGADWDGQWYDDRYWQFVLNNALAKTELLQNCPQWMATQQERQGLLQRREAL